MSLETLSAFDSPDNLWRILTSGKKITFREYEGTGIPPLTMHIDEHDLVTQWENYPKSLMGLQSALIDNANRLVEWKYFNWSDKNQHSELSSHYRLLVDKYKKEISKDLSRYFSFHRNIEAGSNYSRFLIHEQTLLKLFVIGFIFDWQEKDLQIAGCETKPAIENMPDHYQEDNDQIKGNGFSISRRSYGRSRKTIVDINDIDLVTAEQLVDWLRKDYHCEYNGKTVFKPDSSGDVIGTDAYGMDFYAGNIKNPSSILNSMKEQSLSEKWQDQFE